MQASSVRLEELLGGNSSPFFIPPFQRSYAWEKPELGRFFDDVKKLLDSELSGKEPKLQHFFGTLVVKSELEGFRNKIIIVDGQQRITTSLILLIAIRDTIANEEEKRHINTRYLQSTESKYPYGIKLKQVTADWDSYKAIMQGENAPKGLITNAYNYFCRRLKSLLSEGYEVSISDFLEVYRRINLAYISLEDNPWKGEDPQIIFETLNSLGRPLTLADLIRNYILLGLNSEKQSEVYDTIWFPDIEERLTGKETSNYFRDFCQYKLSVRLPVVSDNNTKELYAIFKEKVASQYDDTDNLILEVSRVADLYRAIVDIDYTPDLTDDVNFDRQVKRLLVDIFHQIKSDPFKPFVLGLLVSHQGYEQGPSLCDGTLLSALKIIKTYLVRRRVCDLSSGENMSIPLLSQYIPKLVSGEKSMLDLLIDQPYNLRMPNDTEVSNRLKTIPFYKEVQKYAKFILGEMETYRSKVAVDYRDKNVTIEHIMPQVLTENWRNELGEDYEEVQKNLVHNIGNLILTEFNTEIGNKPFPVKKNKLESSSLGYRLDIIGLPRWDQTAILSHQAKMIDLFLSTFHLPDDYREANNWNEKKIDNNVITLDEIDNDLELSVKGTKPTTILIGGKVYHADNWKNLLFVTLKFLMNSYQDIYNKLVDDYNTPLKQGKAPDVINWKDERLYDGIPSFGTRYALVDGTRIVDIDSKYIGDKRLIFNHGKAAWKIVTTIAAFLDYFHVDRSKVVITYRRDKED